MGKYICLIIYAVLAFLWALLLLRGRAYDDLIEPLDSKKYPLKNFFGIGFSILGLINYSYNTPLDTKRLAQCKIVYGERFAEYYYRVSVAEKVTYIYTCIVIGPLIGALTGKLLYSAFGLVAAGIAYYVVDSRITDIMSERSLSIAKDFADMVSKMALLINAGMITREAWDEIAKTGNGVLYREMRQATVDMQNGESEIDAYISFGNRCDEVYVKKFISMLVQNISKGNKELVEFLTNETALAWEEKKHAVKQQGEKASSKMMLPMGLILVGVFIMILVPVLGNMGL
ncbi:MAG: type II secretion system F family protein [Clostridia bacterium]|nr:type II secretion system F family protein [Clostridia bacterium]